MDKQLTKAYIKVMQAYLDDKVIEFKPKWTNGDHWRPLDRQRWNFDYFDYRIGVTTYIDTENE